MKTVDITVAQFLEALKKNGYPWVKNVMVDGLGASCAMGQAARNLIPNDEVMNADDITNFGYALVDSLNHIGEDGYEAGYAFGQNIIRKNDSEDTTTYGEVAAFAEEILSKYHDVTMHINYDPEE